MQEYHKNVRNMIIPVTLLSEYQYCPRKIYYSRVLKIRVEPTQALVKGKLRHKIEEEINIRSNFLISRINRGELDYIYELFRKDYLSLIKRTIINNIALIKKIALNIEELTNDFIQTFTAVAKQAAESIHEIILKHKVLGKDILKYIETEQTAESFIESKELQLRGIIDTIEFIDDKVIPVELKTGSMPKQGVWPSHKLQVGCYVLLCKEKFEDKKVDYGIVRYLDFGEEREIKMNPYLREEIFEIRDKVIKLLTSGEIPERLATKQGSINNKCIHCFYKKKCYAD